MELTRVVLPTARTAGDYQHLGNESNANSLSLAIGESQLRPLLDPRGRPVGIDRRPGRFSDSKCLQLFGEVPFGSVGPRKEDAPVALEIICDYGARVELMAERRFDKFCRHLEQSLGVRDQLFGR